MLLAEVEDPDLFPASASAVLFNGLAHVAVLWVTFSTERATRLDILTPTDLRTVASYGDLAFDLKGVGPAIADPSNRLSGLVVGDGIQVYRADDGATSLANLGELQVATSEAQIRSIDVVGDRLLVAANEGLMRWTPGASNALLGPVQCAWPDPGDTPSRRARRGISTRCGTWFRRSTRSRCTTETARMARTHRPTSIGSIGSARAA